MSQQNIISRAFVICFAANVVQSTAFFLFLHFPGFLLTLGAGEFGIGVLVAAVEIAAIAVSPWVGTLLDTGSRRALLVGGSIVNAGLCAAFLLVDTFGAVLWTLRIAHGAVETLLNAAFFSYALGAIPENRKVQGLGLFGISAMGSVGLGALVGEAAIRAGGYRGLFMVCASLSIAGVLLVLPLKDLPHAGTEVVGRSRRGWFALLGDRTLRTPWVLSLVFFFSMVAAFTFLKTWVASTGIGSVGVYFGVYTATAIILRLLWGSLADRFGRTLLAVFALCMYSAGFLLLAVTAGLPGFLIAAVFGGLGHGMGYPVLLAQASELAGPRDRGSAVSIFNAIDDGAALLAAPVLGWIIEAAGYGPMFASAGAVLLGGIGVVLLLWIARTKGAAGSP